MKKEIYRSFTAALDADTRSGYVISDTGSWLEYEGCSIYPDTANYTIRFRREDAPRDLSDAASVGEVLDAVLCGRIPGQVLYKGKWRTPQDIIARHQSYDWRRYC